jgi:NAD(P)-dependent dehydrogenase (short-subunit alcohol dehydrogenase family)
LNLPTGELNEIANATIFLASDVASFINGHILRIDGGWSAYQKSFKKRVTFR